MLRHQGFAVGPEQAMAFLRAIELLGPRNLDSLRRAGHVCLAPPPERRTEFDALFRAYFHAETEAVAARSLEGDEQEADRGKGLIADGDAGEEDESGKEASAAERFAHKNFADFADHDALTRLEREAHRLPRRRGFRLERTRHGRTIDLRRSLRDVVRHDGDAVFLKRLRRRHVARRIVLLIDISGSMKSHSADYLQFAHALMQTGRSVEAFTFGTRLTRVTQALRRRGRGRAIADASALVADWDGGTRIGESLHEFIAEPRHQGLIRGAVLLILSDGLERGDHSAMTEAVRRLARLAWHVHWLTPLAADPRFRPETAAIKSILGYIDGLADGATIDALVENTLKTGKKNDRGHGRRASSYLVAGRSSVALRSDAAPHLRSL
jgi:uncharacterized protein with von Willebrand factor type A (vWA) domain